MNWQLFIYENNIEKLIGRPSSWDKIQRKYERLSAKNPDTRYAIGKI